MQLIPWDPLGQHKKNPRYNEPITMHRTAAGDRLQCSTRWWEYCSGNQHPRCSHWNPIRSLFLQWTDESHWPIDTNIIGVIAPILLKLPTSGSITIRGGTGKKLCRVTISAPSIWLIASASDRYRRLSCLPNAAFVLAFVTPDQQASILGW